MKKILLSSVVCASMMFAANSDYKYEVTPMIGGVYTEGNIGLERNYPEAGVSFGINQFDSYIDQVEIGFLRSLEDVEYQDSNGNKIGRDTGVTRVFTNVIKNYPLMSNLSLYGLVGVGVEFFDDQYDNNTNGIFGNYGLGVKYNVLDNLALKFDLRHVVGITSRNGDRQLGDNNLLYTLGLAMPFGKVAKEAPVVEPVIVEEVVVVEEVDSDGDGISDANDKCPNTFPGAVVDENGCELDDDNDGVVNRLDQCPNTIEGAEVDSVGCMTLVDLQINFPIDSSVINDSYGSRIAKFAEAMNNNTKLKATIKAYTDSTGSEKYNQKLSERRAKSAVEALKALNIDASRLTAIGYGEKDPIATNKTKEGRAANRRVTAVINK